MNNTSCAYMDHIQCHICGAHQQTHVLECFAALPRVTSDCYSWPSGGILSLCTVCHTVQKPITKEWLLETTEIYNNYQVYHQANGIEQAIFDITSAAIITRSMQLVSKLLEMIQLPSAGRLLDIGCGNGAFLRAFSSLQPNWRLEGQELSSRYAKEVKSIKNVTTMHNCSINELNGPYDLISAVHVLEHINQPRYFLEALATKMNSQGVLFLQVPNYLDNPFDLLIADHCSHFTPLTLTRLMKSVGFEILLHSTDWVTKEISLLACQPRSQPQTNADRVEDHGLTTPH